MKAVLLKLPNNGGDSVTNSHRLSANEASSTRIGLYLIEWLAKRIPWEFPDNLLSRILPRLYVVLHIQTASPMDDYNVYTTH